MKMHTKPRQTLLLLKLRKTDMNRHLKKLCAAAVLAACSGSAPPETAVNAFWSALEEGDTAAAGCSK
jgi:hypothetical protein